MRFFVGLLFMVLLWTRPLSAQTTLPSEFLLCLHLAETSGRTGRVVGDGGRALGPFQITESYWKDSGVYGSYDCVTDYQYASYVVEAYLRRYAPYAVATGDYYRLARIHNGGPRGDTYRSTEAYGRRVYSNYLALKRRR